MIESNASSCGNSKGGPKAKSTKAASSKPTAKPKAAAKKKPLKDSNGDLTMDDSVMDVDDHISDGMNSEDEPGTKAVIAPKKKDKSAIGDIPESSL